MKMYAVLTLATFASYAHAQEYYPYNDSPYNDRYQPYERYQTYCYPTQNQISDQDKQSTPAPSKDPDKAEEKNGKQGEEKKEGDHERGR